MVAFCKDTSAIVGVVLAHDFGREAPSALEEIDLSLELVIALIDGLEEVFQASHDVVAGTFLHIFMIAVHDDWGGKGIAHDLVQACLSNAREKNYAHALTEATNKTSQHVFAKAGFNQTAMARYADFEFRGEYPFLSIADQVGCALMEIELGEPSR